MDNIFLGCPTHNGQIEHRTIKSLFTEASANHRVLVKVHQTSLLAAGCNQMLCDALNGVQGESFKWFAMLHSDIAPEALWLDKLIDLAEANGADLLSAVVPIKNSEGVTSTAISFPGDPFTRFARLTQRQIRRKGFPTTFDVKGALVYFNPYTPHYPEPLADSILLVNTGCMVVRLDKPWSHELYFTIRDRIVRTMNGFEAHVEPEDWFFSRRVHELGGKVMATSAVAVEHVGSYAYRNDREWGYEFDPAMNKVI
jgi:GT2 family glycosyltransferase